MAKTLLLDQKAWDLVLDASGNIAVANAPYATAQDVACAQRTLKNDCWYDTERGIPYREMVLGELPPKALFQHWLEEEAKRVPLVDTATAVITSFADGKVGGFTECTLTTGQTVTTTV